MTRNVSVVGSILIGLLFFVLTTAPFYAAIPAEERASLIAFYNAMNGDNWSIKSGWKDEPLEADGFGPIGSEGMWYGITVTDDHVTVINFPGNLEGSLPPELGNFSYLKKLVLWYNRLNGGIPAELGNLSNLTFLNLYLSGLTGSIPPELGNLSNLTGLALGSNLLTGTIPPELGNLKKLSSLHLDSNRLTGSIPPELGNLSNLQYLWLFSNQLSGSIPPEMGNLSELYVLYLNSNQLKGSIPSTLSNLMNLSSGGTDFGYNALYANDETLRAFLNSKDSDWEATQTVAPTDVFATPLSTSSIRISWTPIVYTGNTGGYEVYYSTAYGGPWNYSGITSDKSSTSYEVVGLSPGTTYHFVIRTRTDPHSKNSTAIVSNYSEEASATTHNVVGTCTISLNRTTLNFASIVGGSTSSSQKLMITSKNGTLNWMISADVAWLNLYPTSGTDSSVVTVSINPSGLVGLLPGTYTGTIIVSASNAVNSPQTISVLLTVYDANATEKPFGYFETPTDGSTVMSSIPVTGWVLDDIEVMSVKIYRQANKDLVYIGDAIFVDGARPDVQLAYPNYPKNYQAGWGYMMLTNFLPNGGNGTFTLYAIAADKEGHQVTLGTKTIICDNAHAVKPFGAIDAPQGGTVFGTNYRNQGWVLTPQPNKIPEDGHTITVWINGIDVGKCKYNVYRRDIAVLFPGYANSNGALAYFDFDTTVYKNGVHTIQWTAVDNAGNVDGIGSRYFSTRNTGTDRGKSSTMSRPGGNQTGGIRDYQSAKDLSRVPFNALEPVGIRKGNNLKMKPQIRYPDDSGNVRVVSKELERMEIHLKEKSPGKDRSAWIGFHVIGHQLKVLPVGSTLDTERGVFYWQPGPGFLGNYQLVFIEKDRYGNITKKNVRVTIAPKFR